MHPATSVILFTVLSGLGLGLFTYLGLGVARPTGAAAFAGYALAYGLTTGGLVASTFHLGNPQRALRAFSQWRTSWLSREAWLAAATLAAFAPVALVAIIWQRQVPVLGGLAAVLALATVLATAMIYAQMRTVPRWNHWSTPALFFAFALSGGAILAAPATVAAAAGFGLAAFLALTLWRGDGRFGARATTMATATGLGATGTVRAFEAPHTGGNYLTREMIHVVGRRHRAKLRWIAVAAAGVVPALVLLVLPGGVIATGLAAGVHLLGALVARWLFFAEAEHVVGLYYGRR